MYSDARRPKFVLARRGDRCFHQKFPESQESVSDPVAGSDWRRLRESALRVSCTTAAGVKGFARKCKPAFLPASNAPIREPVSILRNHGFRAIVAENGQEAIDLFRGLQGQIALVLLDMAMSGLGGE